MTQTARKGKLYQLQYQIDLSSFIVAHVPVSNCPGSSIQHNSYTSPKSPRGQINFHPGDARISTSGCHVILNLPSQGLVILFRDRLTPDLSDARSTAGVVVRRKMESKLYVGNLSYSTTEDDLRNLFAQAGTVASVALIKDRDSG